MLVKKELFKTVYYECDDKNMVTVAEIVCDNMNVNNLCWCVTVESYSDQGIEIEIEPRGAFFCEEFDGLTGTEIEDEGEIKNYNDDKDVADMYYCDVHEDVPLGGNDKDGWFCECCDDD
jgi:hypothetical protein